MIEILTGFPDNVLAAAAHGKLTGDDYRKVLQPAVEEKMRGPKPVRFFYHLGLDYDGIDMGALVEDARTGLSHWKDWGAIAVVTDAASVRDMVGFFGLFFHHPVRVFFNADYDKAKAWISAVTVKDAA
ncbi:MAG TPA: STAS/SEC14 domain-containing protein [Rhizomicrobium sp.]|nr:STAS/SEC14 domain-containing protein [Rhizomicrobium sp.]